MPPIPKTDLAKFCLISFLIVDRSVPAGKVLAKARPLLSNFQPNIMLSKRIAKVTRLVIATITPIIGKNFRTVLIVFRS